MQKSLNSCWSHRDKLEAHSHTSTALSVLYQVVCRVFLFNSTLCGLELHGAQVLISVSLILIAFGPEVKGESREPPSAEASHQLRNHTGLLKPSARLSVFYGILLYFY